MLGRSVPQRTPTTTLFAQIRTRATALRRVGNARDLGGYYHCGEGSAQVFMVGSLGVLKSDITQIYPIEGGTQTFTRDESSFAWGGRREGVPEPQISLRPQFRLVFSEQTGVMGQATGSVAVGFHW